MWFARYYHASIARTNAMTTNMYLTYFEYFGTFTTRIFFCRCIEWRCDDHFIPYNIFPLEIRLHYHRAHRLRGGVRAPPLQRGRVQLWRRVSHHVEQVRKRYVEEGVHPLLKPAAGVVGLRRWWGHPQGHIHPQELFRHPPDRSPSPQRRGPLQVWCHLH